MVQVMVIITIVIVITFALKDGLCSIMFVIARNFIMGCKDIIIYWQYRAFILKTGGIIFEVMALG